MSKLIYHIYWGTSGNSGLYLDEIYQVLKEERYEQRVFVSYYYPFDYGNKIFFKRGDISNSRFNGIPRKIIQLLEVLKGYLIILCYSIIERPKLINYSHASESYFFIVWFLKLLKVLSGARLIITCHDVKPHGLIPGEMHNRYKIFQVADNLLIHNEQSKEDLKDIFFIPSSKVVMHPFPIMDLSKITKDTPNPFNNVDFLFIGHLRKDKGIELLLDAWKEFSKINGKTTLRIAGRLLRGLDIDKDLLEKCNVDFQFRYISDDDYYHYVKASRYVVLPYIQGTNSGIISTVLSLGTEVLTSDIPMFTQNPLVPESNTFVSENLQSLVDTLQKLYFSNNKSGIDSLVAYKKEFKESVIRAYSSLFKMK